MDRPDGGGLHFPSKAGQGQGDGDRISASSIAAGRGLITSYKNMIKIKPSDWTSRGRIDHYGTLSAVIKENIRAVLKSAKRDRATDAKTLAESLQHLRAVHDR